MKQETGRHKDQLNFLLASTGTLSTSSRLNRTSAGLITSGGGGTSGPPQSRSHQKVANTNRLKHSPTALAERHACDQERLDALIHLLKSDLHDDQIAQEDIAQAKFMGHPSGWNLLLEVKRLATVLANTCRSHAAKCADIHAMMGDADPAGAAMGTILITLSEHLKLPPDGTLVFQDWPEDNSLCDFVLHVAGSPFDEQLVVTRILPRWEPKSGFARKLAGLHGDGKDAPPFLTIAETRKELRRLEESFRAVLLGKLRLSEDEAVLHSIPKASPWRNLNLKSPIKKAVTECLLQDADVSNNKLLEWLRRDYSKLVPKEWGDDPKRAFDTFTKVRRVLGITKKKPVNRH